MQTKIWVVVTLIVAFGWFGWHAVEFQRCGERNCAPVTDQPALQLPSGQPVHVLSTRASDRGRLAVEYLTGIDRDERDELCKEARAVWSALAERMDLSRVTRAELLPTSPDSEFLGMSYLVVPLYTCCVTTPLEVRKNSSGGWSFPGCPRE